MPQVSINLSDAQLAVLKLLAAKRGLSVTALFRSSMFEEARKLGIEPETTPKVERPASRSKFEN